MAHNLVIINEPSDLTTFEDSRGRGTNIDVTLTTRRIRVSTPWRVQDDCHSDHRRITFAVIVDGMPERNLDQPAANKESYDLKKANWPALVRTVRNNLESTDWASLQANDKARVLQEVLRRACEEQIPKRGSNKYNNKDWWSPELNRLRRSLKRKREKWMRTRDEQDRNMFIVARNRYRTATRAAKRAAWLKQIEKAELEDPWGKVYKIVRGKLSPPLMLTTLRKDDGTYTSDERETLEFFLERMLPDDQVDLNDPEERRLRENMTTFGEDVEKYFTMGELDSAVKRIKNKKAPGPDGLKGEVIKAIFPVIKEVFLRILNEVWRSGYFPEVWKDGEVKIFLKGPEKPPDEVKSYRPITLLPVLGKVYERLIVGRIWRAINERELMQPFQHGVELEGNETKKKKRWLSLQRKVLIKTIKAYRTVSYEAMWVVSGFPPLDLKIAERRGIREDRTLGIDKKVSALNRENNMIDAWQNRWSDSTKGRTSWSFCDNVRHRLNNDWELNHYVVQFLTGHGNFNAKLHGFGLVDNPMCLACGELEETSEHVLWACPHFNREREAYREALELAEDPLDLRSEMTKERNRKELFKMMTNVGKRKEAEERERRLNMD